MHVLIVDDQPSSRSILRCVLERIDMELNVHEFGQPEAALALRRARSRGRGVFWGRDHPNPPVMPSVWRCAIFRRESSIAARIGLGPRTGARDGM